MKITRGLSLILHVSRRKFEEDLRARDFTINALAYNLRDETIIDPLDGGKICAKIRACSPTSLSDDLSAFCAPSVAAAFPI